MLRLSVPLTSRKVVVPSAALAIDEARAGDLVEHHGGHVALEPRLAPGEIGQFKPIDILKV